MKPEEWKAVIAEGIGTALLIFGGISFIIIDFGPGSIVASYVPDAMVRRFVTGFLFGSVGCLITLSPLGRISGAHLNPAVTIAFFGRGLLPWRALFGYIIAQLAGATLGAEALAVWGSMGDSLREGITVPGHNVGTAFAGEAFVTFCLICVILLFTSHDRLKAYTPFMIPPLFSVLVGLEAPLSGCSANPARSFGPAVWSGIWTDHWLYWLAPVTGTFGALLVFALPVLQWLRTDIAKLYHFRHDETGFLRGQEQPASI
ncbi:aquaporin Z [Spirosoma oryzae]|uniref:Aquaporin Z n=1 Tax=Spirosoma oryzae TaxID=1469603 RepID=A0A2T0SNF7_9BACT|nr:aquaporin [Spirosoma oryzae]PRY34951.1 aquaporin Z [Spirosoma oryzae]